MTNSGDRPLHRNKKSPDFRNADQHPAQHKKRPFAKSREKSGAPLILDV